MDKFGTIKLLKTEYTQGAYGQNTSTTTERSLMCNIASISAAEFFRAGNEGLRPEKVFYIWANEYNNEDALIFEGIKYSVYRTYENKNGRIELYTHIKAGDNE